MNWLGPIAVSASEKVVLIDQAVVLGGLLMRLELRILIVRMEHRG
jgi:hypothetical protein